MCSNKGDEDSRTYLSYGIQTHHVILRGHECSYLTTSVRGSCCFLSVFWGGEAQLLLQQLRLTHDYPVVSACRPVGGKTHLRHWLSSNGKLLRGKIWYDSSPAGKTNWTDFKMRGSLFVPLREVTEIYLELATSAASQLHGEPCTTSPEAPA